MVDDVLVFGKEHNARLTDVCNRICTAGATLNPDKCEVSKTASTYLDMLSMKTESLLIPEKTQALKQMKALSNVSELRRFLGS